MARILSPISMLMLSSMIASVASTTVLSLFGFITGEPLYGSVITQISDTTLFAIQCIPTTPYSPCVFATTTPFTYLTGPSTVSFNEGPKTDEAITVTCNITGTTEATCITSQSYSLAATETLRSDILDFSFMVSNVTITGGLPSAAATPITSSAGTSISSTSSAVVRTTPTPSQAIKTTSAGQGTGSNPLSIGGVSTTSGAPTSSGVAVSSTTKTSNAAEASHLQISWKVIEAVVGTMSIILALLV